MKPLLLTLVLALIAGCSQDAAPTPDDNCVPDAPVVEVPQKTVVAPGPTIFEQLQKRMDALEVDQKGLHAEFTVLKRRIGVMESANSSGDVAGDMDDLHADIANLKSRLVDVESESHSCPVDPRVGQLVADMAALKPKPKATAPADSKLDKAIESAKASDRKVLLILRRTDCKFCDSLENNVLNDPGFQASIEPAYVLCQVNIDTETIGWTLDVHKTPAALIYHTDTGKWDAAFVPSQSMGGFLVQLGVAPYVPTRGLLGRRL